ncbi:MAG TPA: DUF998 domain-containing protein [Amycolatopsis sp.]|uniref:DUF998 domain-containing protein n=1 Tax=Amycolatopsis sp. TaxID=37632 RepID=UPI002B4626B5|nr:DUF998 domain-containing protein [Amycolatopsis sp.]HKS44447.1 DUF998 domain-containing protein [Amycolatopsis sp.]
MPPYAGIVGPIVFTVGFPAQDLLRSNHNPISQQIDELEAGSYGWVPQANFVVFGLLMITSAVGPHRGVRLAGPGTAGPAIVAWNGAGLVIAAIFPMREDADGRIYDPTGVHHVNGAIFFWTTGLGLAALSRGLARDPHWRDLATYTPPTGIALLAMAAITGPLARLEPVDLDPWAGLAQRATLAVWLPCIVILALRLRRLTGVTDSPAHPGGRTLLTDPPLDPETATDTGYAAMPRWVKVFGILLLAMILAFLITLITRGPHRPGMPGMRHSAGTTPTSSAVAPAGNGGHNPADWGHE